MPPRFGDRQGAAEPGRITAAFASELDADALRRSLGHTTLHMTLRYIAATDEDLIQAWKRRRD